MAVVAFAPAKVNLYLHVLGRREDGYHLLDSLVAFADIGDSVSAAPAAALSLTVGGPEAAAVAPLGEDNLVLRAARALAAQAGVRGGAALHLEKRLPVAAGIGGGSADAAAALRVLEALWDRPVSESVLASIALQLGADVPACLAGRPVWVGGIGERIEPAPPLPPLGIVLANPRRPAPTPEVFRERRGPLGATARFDPMSEPAGFPAQLASRRNDLTEAALRVVPEIETVLDRLGRLPGALLARMSGSGATCFGLFADREAALTAGALLGRLEPGWWRAAGALLTAAPAVLDVPD
ncbi:MAG TPA: 4-(cytidine 5'-diphospho)-2-C-methyl-D-erythritol kinase [Stellaceae bacterium]